MCSIDDRSSMDCVLILTLATGGQLKYCLRFVTLDSPADDEIILEAAGLNRSSIIGFRLYSPTEYVHRIMFLLVSI
jgi:hypothetical protein